MSWLSIRENAPLWLILGVLVIQVVQFGTSRVKPADVKTVIEERLTITPRDVADDVKANRILLLEIRGLLDPEKKQPGRE